jgi:hypothetical protein
MPDSPPTGNSHELPKDANVQSNVPPRRAELSGASSSEELHEEQAAKHPGGRPHVRWRIRVVRIDPKTHPDWMRPHTNPFAVMAPPERIAEIDAFCARLWARTKRKAA